MKRMWKIRLALYLIALPLSLVYPVKIILDMERPIAPPQEVEFPEKNQFTFTIPVDTAVKSFYGYASLDCRDGKLVGIKSVAKCRKELGCELILPANVYPETGTVRLVPWFYENDGVEKLLIYPGSGWVKLPSSTTR